MTDKEKMDILLGRNEPKQGWISVKERFPENEMDRVLVMTKGDAPVGNQKMDTDRCMNERWVRYGDKVTHWMYLPKPPKGDG